MRSLTREQFEPARSLLEQARRRTRPRRHDLYDVFSAVVWFLETSGPWRSMPKDFPPWRTVHEYYTQWTLPIQHPPLLERALVLAQREELVTVLHQLLRRNPDL